MKKIKSGYVYNPKERIKNACLQDDIYIVFTILWWARTEDCMFRTKRWITKKKIVEEYEYGWYVPSHQELG